MLIITNYNIAKKRNKLKESFLLKAKFKADK